MKARFISKTIKKAATTLNGRIIVLTGARQTGKTTLSREVFGDYTYLSIEDPVMAGELSKLSAAQWKTLYPKATLDEIQKQPRLIESIKSVYDQWDTPRYVLLGSSQILLLKNVKESLAGRCLIKELFPLTLPEIKTTSWSDDVALSPLQRMLLKGSVPNIYPSFQLDPEYSAKMQAWREYLQYGGYPAVYNEERNHAQKREWLENYTKTHLERDVRDLAAMRDLEPYRKLQSLLALQTGELCNISSIATHVGMSTTTIKRYLQYLSISYQTLILPSWEKNKEKRLVKSPKIHYLDHGVLQAVLQKQSVMPNGNEFESLVVAEIYKQLKQIEAPVSFYHLHTADGREVDLLVEEQGGYYAFEIKLSEHIQRTDAKHLRDLGKILDKPLLHSFVLSNDPSCVELEEGITAVHCAQLLG